MQEKADPFTEMADADHYSLERAREEGTIEEIYDLLKGSVGRQVLIIKEWENLRNKDRLSSFTKLELILGELNGPPQVDDKKARIILPTDRHVEKGEPLGIEEERLRYKNWTIEKRPIEITGYEAANVQGKDGIKGKVPYPQTSSFIGFPRVNLKILRGEEIEEYFFRDESGMASYMEDAINLLGVKPSPRLVTRYENRVKGIIESIATTLIPSLSRVDYCGEQDAIQKAIDRAVDTKVYKRETTISLGGLAKVSFKELVRNRANAFEINLPE